MIDYDDYECGQCHRVGVWPNGDFDYECPSCGYEGTIGVEPGDEDDDDDDDEEDDDE